MADGSVKIDVGLSTGKAEKELAKLKDKISKLEGNLSEKAQKKSGIETSLNKARAEAENTAKEIKRINDLISEGERFLQDDYKGKVTSDDYNRVAGAVGTLKEQLAEQEKIQKDQSKNVDKLSTEYSKLDEEITKGTQNINGMKEQAGQMVREIEKSRPGEAIASSLDLAKKKMMTFLKYAVGIRSVYILFRRLKAYIKDAVAAYAEQDETTKNSINGIKNALEQLKLSWGAAFAPILNAVAPLIQRFIGWMTEGANAVAKFMAVLSGKNTYKRAVAGNQQMTKALEKTSNAAKETRKQLMGFDEINRLDDNTPFDSGTDAGSAPSSAIQMIEEAIDMNSAPARLAFAVRDVFFDWSDLTAEQIMEKALAGFLGLGGALIGGMVGGVPGAIIGLTAGLILGTVLDSTIFNFDGELSKDEFSKSLIAAAGFTGGAIIGFMAGGPVGAAIGAVVGLAFTAHLNDTLFDSDGTLNKESLNGLLEDLFRGPTRMLEHTPEGRWILHLGLGISFDITDAILPTWEKIKGYFQPYIDKWNEGASEDAKSVGFGAVMGILEGIWDGMKELLGKLYDATVGPIVKSIKDWLGIHSPSTVFKEIGGQMIDGLWGGVQEKWNSFVGFFEGLWTNLRSWWDGLSLAPFHIPRPQFEWGSREVGGGLAGVLNFFGLPAAMPTLSISWAARGGIVDGATLIGAGEAGKEAIVPLERNTEWISMVAEGLLDRMRSASRVGDSITGRQLPAMATGGIVPPRAVSNGGFFTDGDIDRLVNGIVNAFGGGDMGEPIPVNIDGRKVAEIITRHQRLLARGGSLGI